MLFALFVGIAALAAGGAVLWLYPKYVREREELQRVRAQFSRYVPEHVMEDLLRQRASGLLWAQRHRATILCARIRNFEFFAEELDAEETLRHLNEFYAVAGRAIIRHGGVIERLHGDGITAVFGILSAQGEQEECALRAALRIIRLADAMNERWRAQGRHPFYVSIGVCTGNIVAGEVGFARRREFAAVGHAAHVAALLQEAAEDVHASILAAASTVEPVREMFATAPIASLPLAGLRRLQHAYVIRGLNKPADDERLLLPPSEQILETLVEAPKPAQLALRAYDSFLPAMPQAPSETFGKQA